MTANLQLNLWLSLCEMKEDSRFKLHYFAIYTLRATTTTIEDRSKLLAKNKLCYGCYVRISSDHNTRSCKQRRVCTICKEKHPTGFHGYKHLRKRKLEDNRTNSNENSMTCAATKMKSRVMSMFCTC